MLNKVGIKGQVVIAEEIRDRLGIGPGWQALQRLVDGHVEIYFIPPQHDRSLMGHLAPYTDVVVASSEEWDEARKKAWEVAARERVEGWEHQP